MKSTTTLPAKSAKRVCRACALEAHAPIVRAVANPTHDRDGRCSNREACDARARRNANRGKAKP